MESLFEEARLFALATDIYGGSFFRALGQAALRADAQNIVKIKTTWPDEWERYVNWGRSIQKDSITIQDK